MKNKILDLGLLGCFGLVACGDSKDNTTGLVIEEQKASIVINEFISRNKNDNDNQMRSFLDEEGKYSDWIELKNNGDLNVNLSDYYLSDDPDSLFVFNMRDTIISPGEYYTLFANLSADSDAVLENTAPFKLSFSCGDELYLVKKSDSSVVDFVLFHYGSLNYDYLVSNRSFGRNNENQWVPQVTVTPNLNNQSESGSLESMTKTEERGRYDPVKCEA